MLHERLARPLSLILLLSGCGSAGVDSEGMGVVARGEGVSCPATEVLEAELSAGLERLAGPGRFRFDARWEGTSPLVAPCSEGSPTYEHASALLVDFDTAIRYSDRWDDVDSLTDDLRRLLRHECVATARGLPSWFSSTAALRHFWLAAGYDAVRAALDVERERIYVVPPRPRRGFEALEAEFPGLARFCGALDECQEEASWKSELGEAVRMSALEGALTRLHADPDSIPTQRRCAEAARTAPEERRFEAWQDCITEPVVEGPLLPVGNFRVPEEGWLHVALEPGFMDDSSYVAIDLATGATVTRERLGFPCSTDDDDCERFGASAGSVTNARSARRLLWSLLMEQQTVVGAPEGEAVSIPEAIEPLVGRYVLGIGCGGVCVIFEQYAWAYVSSSGVTLAAGERDGCLRSREAFRPFTEHILAAHESMLRTADGGSLGDVRPLAIDPTDLPESWDVDALGLLVESSRIVGR